jgi:hypothetical protein
MQSASESLSVWQSWGEGIQYIVAALGASAAAKAFRRLPDCRGKVPQPYPATKANTAGVTLATAHPGKIYRRSRRSEAK